MFDADGKRLSIKEREKAGLDKFLALPSKKRTTIIKKVVDQAFDEIDNEGKVMKNKRKLTVGGSTTDPFGPPVSNHSRLVRTLYWLERIKDKDAMVEIEIAACRYFMQGYKLEIEALGGALQMATFPRYYSPGIRQRMHDAKESINLRKQLKPARDEALRAQIKLIKSE